MADWNPQHYLQFEAERNQPLYDLLARLRAFKPNFVVDVGCGPGNSTRALQQAFPAARLAAFDQSTAMVAAAEKALPGVEVTQADVAHWQPPPGVDLLFSNAVFHWVPQHLQHFKRMLQQLARGAVLAVQMPDNLQEPSHRLMAEIAREQPWCEQVQAVAESRADLHEASAYHEALSPSCMGIQVWRTIYYHHFDSHRRIVELFSSTGLKPYLDALAAADVDVFLQRYLLRLQQAYPKQADGSVLFPFPRLFIVAVSAGNSSAH